MSLHTSPTLGGPFAVREAVEDADTILHLLKRDLKCKCLFEFAWAVAEAAGAARL